MKIQTGNFIKNNIVDKLEAYLCPEVRQVIEKLPQYIKEDMEEIRLRITKPLMIYCNNRDYFIGKEGELLSEPRGCYIVKKKNIDNTLQFITNYSLYSVEEEMKRGYITVEGGHRVGIVGKVLYDTKGIKTLKEITGLNFRIAREKRNVSFPILKYLISAKGEFMNTLIISPPQCGKTTLLRDIIRNVSDGIPSLDFRGAKVGVVDERSEIAASFQGVPQNDLGVRTDVLDACPKAEGMMMLIRAMSPEILATDEIGRDEDSMAIQEALLAGIKLITTVHGKSIEDILSKRVIGTLVKQQVFDRIVILSNRQGVGTIEGIIDGHTLKNLLGKYIKNRVAGLYDD